jgi:serine/threonine protein kinase
MAASPSPSPDGDDPVPIGSILDGRYRIDALLGTGGMGRVYRAEHTGIGRAVAIKVLHSDLHRNREASARFQREAIASGRLDHPNITGVSDFGVLEDGACYLVMEVLEGESVGDRLARDKRIPWRDALAILRSVLLGLRHAHDRGVVHRDIKPDNVYLAKKDGDTIVKILDFGIAKLRAGTADDPASTRAGLTVGTPAYLSPEQAVGGEITPASDLYSSTIVLFEMLAGRTPFEDKDPLAMLGAHVSREPPRIADVAPEIELPLGLEEVIQEGLVKTAKDRIASAADYIAKIDAILTMRASGRISISSGFIASDLAAVASAPNVIASPAPGTVKARAATGGSAPMIVSKLATPIPGSQPTVAAGAAPTTALPQATRAVSLHDITEPVPRKWILIGGAVLLILVLLAIIAGMATRDSGAKPQKTPASFDEAQPPSHPSAAPAEPEKPATVAKAAPFDHEGQLKSALAELKNYKHTCQERSKLIPILVDLDDPAAIAPLKAARYVGYGGVLGFGEKNANWCMTKELDAAVKELTAHHPQAAGSQQK